MATEKQPPSLFSSARTSQPVVFHRNHGENIELSQGNTVATRVGWTDYGIVCTSELVPIGQMFKVTVLKKEWKWPGGLRIAFTRENPETSKLPLLRWLSDYKNDEHLLYISGAIVMNKDKKVCDLGFDTEDLNIGQSLGVLLTRERDFHWFVDDKWRGVVQVDGYPLDKPLWGVAEVYARCTQVKAEILSGYDKSQMVEAGLITSPCKTRPTPLRQWSQPLIGQDQRHPVSEDLLHQLLQEQESLRQHVQRKDVTIKGLQAELNLELVTVSSLQAQLQAQLQQQVSQSNDEIGGLQQQMTLLTRGNSQLRQQNQQLQQQKTRLQQQVSQSNGEIGKLQQQMTLLTRENNQFQQQIQQFQQQNNQLQQQVTQSNGEISRLQQQVTQSTSETNRLQQQNQQLQQQVLGLRRMLSATNRQASNSQDIDFWQVSPEEVSIREDQVLGGGAWGYVAKGTFRGTSVAVKRVYPSILQQNTLDRIRREIRTMAQVRHPNLVLFIAAVLNEHTGPMIVTELLDISLRQAYQTNCVGLNKRNIFKDISSALVYLHEQREPIIHRDVSSANVLLISSHKDTWLAKLADFGSANLAQYATTPGEGAILYTAPEAYPHPPTSPTPPPPQTTKIDVYSFGILACEVITRVFPESHKLTGLMETVHHSWPQIHQLIISCVSHSPQDRPAMSNVLTWLQQLDNEP